MILPRNIKFWIKAFTQRTLGTNMYFRLFFIDKKLPEASSTQSFLTICLIQYLKFLTSFLIFIFIIPTVLTWWVNKDNITIPKKNAVFSSKDTSKQRHREKYCLYLHWTSDYSMHKSFIGLITTLMFYEPKIITTII